MAYAGTWSMSAVQALGAFLFDLHAAAETSATALGDGTAGGVRAAFAGVAALANAIDVAVGGYNAIALRDAGSLWGWGIGSFRANGTTDSAGNPHGAPAFISVEATPFPLTGR